MSSVADPAEAEVTTAAEVIATTAGEPYASSPDQFFDYYLWEHSRGVDLQVVGPWTSLEAEAVTYHGFPTWASALVWVDVHAGSDLGMFALLRASRAMHLWARRTGHLFDFLEAETVAEHGGRVG